MSEAESKRAIEQALRAFAAQPLKAAATGLFIALRYASKKTLDLKPNGLEGFCAMFDPNGQLNRKQALGGDWRTVRAGGGCSHLGQPAATPRIAPARGPPLWAAAGAEWVDPSLPWDPSAQPEPAYEFDQRIAW